MKKIIILSLSLLFVNSALAATSESCESYKKQMDSYLIKMKEMGTQQTQIDMLSQQFEQSFTQIKNLPAESQEMTCKQCLDALKQTMEAANIK